MIFYLKKPTDHVLEQILLYCMHYFSICTCLLTDSSHSPPPHVCCLQFPACRQRRGRSGKSGVQGSSLLRLCISAQGLALRYVPSMFSFLPHQEMWILGSLLPTHTPRMVYVLSMPHFWRRQWHPSPVLLLGKSHGWRSLLGCNPWGR